MDPPQARDEAWFTGLYHQHRPDIVRYGLRRLADTDAAGELAQEVFVVAWRRRAEVPDHGLPWLYGVARRLLANEWRARRSAPQVVPLDGDLLPSNGCDPEATVVVADVRAALATLSENDQEVLRLVGWEELSLAEVAAVLGCSRPTAAVRLHRARRRLVGALDAGPVPPRPPAALASLLEGEG